VSPTYAHGYPHVWIVSAGWRFDYSNGHSPDTKAATKFGMAGTLAQGKNSPQVARQVDLPDGDD
jgi:hypothetical protein